MFETVAPRTPRRSIETSVVVSCPRSVAIARAIAYFDGRRRLDCGRVVGNVAISVDRVTVRTSFTPRSEEALHLRLTPTHRGPVRAIDGVLTARAHATHAVLRFVGTSAPSSGHLARTFETLVGRHIARVAIGTLLRDIERAIEREGIADRVPQPAAPRAHRRETHGRSTRRVAHHGNVVIRRVGSYVACAITIEGDTPPYAALQPCDRALSPERVASFLGALLEPDVPRAPSARAT